MMTWLERMVDQEQWGQIVALVAVSGGFASLIVSIAIIWAFS